MLVYLATYPRCGSAFLRDMIAANWGLATANGYAATDWPAKLEVADTGHPDLVSYNCRHRRARMIRGPAIPRLTPDLRRLLGSSREMFLVKTHERPPVDPMPGEIAIQMVRHPGAALVSHWLLQHRQRDDAPNFGHFCGGADTGGLWAEYHAEWLDSRMPVHRIRYEDILADPAPMVSFLANALGLPAPEAPVTRTLAEATALNPARNLGLGADGWRLKISPYKIARTWELHGEVAARFGYDETGVADHASFQSGTYLIRPMTSALAVA